jgi:type I protein arginine methyltransferase
MTTVELSPEVFDRAFDKWRTKTTCRPTIGEYPVYDEHLYRWLLEDTGRMTAYRRAIMRAAPGRHVVDLGTGAEAPLALMCARAGAAHVDAIELIPEAAAAARRKIHALGLTDSIQVHCGPSCNIRLERPADLCVSEIIGMIGGAEGADRVLRNARRFLAPHGRMLPSRCTTWFAPATKVCNPYTDSDCAAVSEYYRNRIFHALGKRISLTRTVTFNFPKSNLLADKHPFEILTFTGKLAEARYPSVTFEIKRTGCCDGFVLWIELRVDDYETIDSWRGSSWAPVFLEMQPVELEAGDIIKAKVTAWIEGEDSNPSYRIDGHIHRGDACIGNIAIHSPYA